MLSVVVKRSLIHGRFMLCPRCKRQHAIELYVPLETIEEFAAETTPVYKCPTCKWIFAPADEMPHQLVSELMDRIESLVTEGKAVPA